MTSDFEPTPNASRSDAALVVERVVKQYDRQRAVDGIGFTVARGELFGLLGPNGAGKTTLLRMIMDILRPDEGEIRLLGHKMTPALKDRVSYLPEERGLYQRQKVFDVLVFLGEIKGLPRHVARRRADQYLDRVGLLAARRKKMRELSKGMQQKIQIAGVLLHEPELVILDEPFIGLDPLNRALIIEVMKETAARGAAIILSTHLMDQVEALCGRILLIHQGREVLSGTVRAAKERFADASVRIDTDAPLEGRPEVQRCTPEGPNGLVRVHLNVKPEAFLATLLAEGRAIRRFERALPSLDEVFINATQRGVP
ncbi:MAG: ATP-binding cassette domain-containing protein [Planctomycetes bacterium]|nr:ATP-binding cassette domain-containing protein [Planctomycetota bacterium]